MFYGIIQEDYLYEDYILQEIDFKQAISVVKLKIKNAILRFIDKVDAWLDKHKDSKIKSFIQSLLQGVRKLLVRCKDIETETDAKFVYKELDNYREQFKDSTDIKINHVGVHVPEDTLNKIKDYCKREMDKSFDSYIELQNSIGDNSLSAYYGQSKYDLKRMYSVVVNTVSNIYRQVQLSTIEALENEINKTELYKDVTYQNSLYYGRFKDGYTDIFNKYHKEIVKSFKPKKYNGQSLEKYFEDTKEYIISTMMHYIKQLEVRFNKVAKDMEILNYKKEKEFQDRLSNLRNSANK
jgi:hypothetical protein